MLQQICAAADRVAEFALTIARDGPTIRTKTGLKDHPLLRHELAALDREIASEADDKAALTHEARQKAEAEVMGDLLAIERQEASLVWRAQSENLPVEHRPDCSPLALLGLRLIAAAGNGAAGSSSAHSYDVIGWLRR
jgi:hypothetical protein